MARYFVAEDQTVHGPLEETEAVALLLSLGNPDTTLVCPEGGDEWVSVAAIPSLARATTAGEQGEDDLAKTQMAPSFEEDDKTAFMSRPVAAQRAPAPRPAASVEPSAAPRHDGPAAREPSVRAPTAPRRAGRRLRMLLAALVALPALGGGSAFALSAYRTHRAVVACEQGPEGGRLGGCDVACERGSDDHCVKAARLQLDRAPADAERRARQLLPRGALKNEATTVLAEALLRQGKAAEAEQLLAPVVETSSPPVDGKRLLAAARLALGMTALQDGKPETAVEKLRSAHELSAQTESALGLGRALAQLERWDEAVKYLERGLETASSDTAQSYRELAHAYKELGKPDAVKKALRRGVSANKSDYALHKALATELLVDKDKEGATRVLEDYAERHAQSDEAHLEALELIGEKDGARRRAFVERWLKQSPESEEACVQAAREWPERDFDERLRQIKECTGRLAQPQRLYEDAVSLIEKKRGAKGAHAFLDDELAAHPDRSSLVDLKAQVYVREKKPRAAEELIEKTVAERPDDPVPVVAKARYLESTRSIDAASAVLEAAKERFARHTLPFRYALGFHVRNRRYDRIEGELAALRLLGVPDVELSRLREITTFGRTSVSCVSVGQGPAVAGYDRIIPATAVSNHDGFWSGAAVQRGFIVNRCASVSVNATVTVSFGIRRVTHLFIFAQVNNESKSQSFTFRNLRPGEARPFSAGVSLDALSFGYSPVGTLGGAGTYSEVSNVSVTLRVLSPRL